MNKVIFLVCLMMPVFVFAQDSLGFKPLFSAVLSPAKGPALMKENSCSRCVPEGINKFWQVNQDLIDTLEANLRSILALATGSANCSASGYKIKNLSVYGYQYIGVILKKKKLIYINAFNYEALTLFFHLTSKLSPPQFAMEVKASGGRCMIRRQRNLAI